MLKTEKDRVIHDLKCQIQEAKDRNEIYIFFPLEKIEKLIEYVEQKHDLTDEELRRIATYY